MKLKKGDIITLKIEKLIYGGDGLGRYENMVVFVPGVAPEEKVKVKIVQTKKSFAKGKVVELLDKSPHRIQPECPFFLKNCGGCQWLHIDYEQQLSIKKGILEETILRKLPDIKILPVIGMENPYHYRNKATAKTSIQKGKLQLGFYGSESHKVVDIYVRPKGECLVQNSLNNTILLETAKILSRNLLWVKKKKLEEVALRSGNVQVNINLPNFLLQQFPSKNRIGDKVFFLLEDKKFAVSGTSFFQINIEQSQILIKKVREFLENAKGNLADIYCGVGLFAICLADEFDEVWGIESSRGAIHDAKLNAKMNKTDNVHWVDGIAEKGFFEISSKIDTIILDPPREGCSKVLLHQIGERSPERIIYVSCDVATLARDLVILDGQGYQTTQIQPVDMFPHTYHIECIAEIVKKE